MADMRLQQQNANKRQKKDQKKSNKSGWGALVIAIVVFNALSGALDGADAEDIVLIAVIGILVVSAIIAGVVYAMKKKAGSGSPVAERSGRVSAAVQRRDPRSRSFTQPEAYCVVCDHTGEDHFQRDKARRIAQLDDWLKNGLIDRAEYQVLKHRYENDL